MTEAASATRERELVFTRVYDASRELLFDLWTDPAHIGEWWGPAGFTTTTNVMDVKVGGVWDYVMHGPDGTDYPSRSAYLQVNAPERLVFDNVGGKADDPHLTCRMTVTFEELGDKTKVELRMSFPSMEAVAHAVENGVEEGGHQALARLADCVAKRSFPTQGPTGQKGQTT